MEQTIKAKSSTNSDFGVLIEDLVRQEISRMLAEKEMFNTAVDGLQDEEDILTIERVAQILGLNVRVVRDKINNGEIPSYQPNFGRRLYVLKSELINEIKSGTQRKSLSMLLNKVNHDFTNHLNA